MKIWKQNGVSCETHFGHSVEKHPNQFICSLGNGSLDDRRAHLLGVAQLEAIKVGGVGASFANGNLLRFCRLGPLGIDVCCLVRCNNTKTIRTQNTIVFRSKTF